MLYFNWIQVLFFSLFVFYGIQLVSYNRLDDQNYCSTINHCIMYWVKVWFNFLSTLCTNEILGEVVDWSDPDNYQEDIDPDFI